MTPCDAVLSDLLCLVELLLSGILRAFWTMIGEELQDRRIIPPWLYNQLSVDHNYRFLHTFLLS